jgi:hypothetical protein
MAKRDLYSLIGDSGDGAALGLASVAVAATTNCTAIDMAASATLPGSESLICIGNFGVCTDGKYQLSLEESDDNSTFAAVAAADVQGSAAVVNAAADGVVQILGYIGDKRYVRAVITETSAGATGVIASVSMLRGHPRHLGNNLMA